MHVCFLDPVSGRCLAVVYVDDGIIASPRIVVDSAVELLQKNLDVTVS